MITEPLSPRPDRGGTATVGMVGAGQLARMTHQAAIALGIDLTVLSVDAEDPAVLAGAAHLCGDPDEVASLFALAEASDVVTFDHELVPNQHLEQLAAAGHQVRPNAVAKRVAQDKAFARSTLARADFPVPPFLVTDAGSFDAVEAFARENGWPLVLKAPRGGYDGRGVEVVRDRAALAASPLAGSQTCWLLEAMVPIAVELAVLVARRPSGWWSTYPVVETVQEDGICRELVMPARIPVEVADRAAALAVSLAEGIDATGILAVEFFVTTDGELLVNEIAARPHNSGHATIDACQTSQFENHLRGILDWPLGATAMVAPAAATVNLLGPTGGLDLRRALPAALEDAAVHVHLYRKDPTPGRKLGHVTALADDADAALASARAAAEILVGR